MKFLLLLLSFLLFASASSINASSFFAKGATADGPTTPDIPPPPPILDVNGAPLEFGVPHYMIPFLGASGGGVSLAPPTLIDLCPKAIQLTPKTDRGTPVVFSSAVPNVTGNITIGSELIINFYNLTRPNAEFCGKSNSTTWVTTRTWNLAVGGEEMSSVFRLSRCVRGGYVLKPVSPFPNVDFVVGIDESGNLLVMLPQGPINLCFAFSKSTEEDKDDKPVFIQMLRKWVF